MKPIVVESHLASDPATVWARVSTMAGVNRELMPVVRMTAPRGRDRLDMQDIVPGEVLFHSWLLLFGFLPYDRHALRLISIEPGKGFHEDSTSWTQKRWTHVRTLTAEGDGTIVRDDVTFAPRMPFLAPLLRPVIAAVFQHRHRVLRREYGEV